MKNIFVILIITLLFASCQQNNTAEYPEDLAGRKALLSEKKKELKSLEKMIDKLKTDIEKEEPPKEKQRKTVSVRKLEKKDFLKYTEIQANVEADDLVAASSETGGRILKMRWKEGDYIKKGSLVATLDMESINKQIAELQTSRSLAQDVFNRQKRLWDQKIGTEIQFLQAKNNLERIDKSLETIKHQLTKANVYSPSSGYVEMVIAKAGEMAGPGTPILQILNTSKLKVVASLPEKFLGKVKRGQMVDVAFPALEKEIKAKISQMGRTIDPANRTFKVEVNLPNSKGDLKPNLLATILVNDYKSENKVVVPLELVQEEISGKQFILIKGEAENGFKAVKVYVETGETYQGDVEINEGLVGNEEIIIDGARSLREDELINIVEEEKISKK